MALRSLGRIVSRSVEASFLRQLLAPLTPPPARQGPISPLNEQPLFNLRRSFSAPKKTADEGKHVPRRNEEIDAPMVRLVLDDGQHEVVATSVALEKAQAAGLDLVEVSSASQPPVARLLDFNKLQKQNEVKERELLKKAKEHQRQEKTREIRLTHMKVKKILELLAKHQKVIVVVMAPSMADKKMGHEALQYIQGLLRDKAKLCQESKLNRQGTVSMTLLPFAESSGS